MRSRQETGVLDGSESLSASPSPLAKELFFYVVRYGHYYCDSRFRSTIPAGREDSRNYILIYVKKGCLHLRDGEKGFSISGGQAAFLDQEVLRVLRAAGATEYYWMVLNGPMAERFYRRIQSIHGNRQAVHLDSSDGIEQEFRLAAMQLRASASPDEAGLSHVVSRLLCRLLREEHRTAPSAEDQTVQNAVRYIDEHFSQDLSVEDVAASVSLSYSHLSRRFKACTDYSIHEYVTHCRLREAQNLLLGTDMPLKRIAASVGYRSEASFIVAFQSKRGCTPTEYRNRRGSGCGEKFTEDEERIAL